MNGLDWAVPLLRCIVCGGSLYSELADGQGILRHEDGNCTETYPVINGIPRLLLGSARASVVRDHAGWFRSPDRARLAARWSGPAADDPVVRSFDAEWSRFDDVRSPELSALFDLYFDIAPPSAWSRSAVVLDAGCGAGRWSLEAEARGPRILALDLGRSVEVARRNARGNDRIACVQADLRALPLGRGAFDWAYSLGVLHHIDAPAAALGGIVRAVRPGGFVLLYLYYALEGRSFTHRAIFRAVDSLRRVTSRLPRPLLVGLTTAIAALVYWPLARLSALVAHAGHRRLADSLPLSFYRDRSLRIMRNDSLDRFGTAVEHRYSRTAMSDLMLSAGLSAIRVSDDAPYWHAVGVHE